MKVGFITPPLMQASSSRAAAAGGDDRPGAFADVLAGAGDYDFSDMTRGEIAEAGKELFRQGKISLDELFRFDHPDGRLRIGLDGSTAALNADDRIDFIGETRKAMSSMEETGEANRAGSGYETLAGLLDKLTRL
ncbi:MAG: hypothetical protein JNN24_13295 [Hyphomicrobium zavarzinii]|jgi:hypothetical protein|uniref:hypothetical protein n=1 Tax=Hyphomicrobium TaxID=81 RepID=UPI0012EC40C7|nr:MULTISPECIES: hypothetical protein [Hyphomicrobium]MBL8846738.1 hypothetical protein [Hyphomicrobium zavarzinii]WBT39850.1 hypothetical protein PE058_08190 [Hyphomicrobium sp. DMF-1]HML44692.1 hypothetical protein [Hyphomicrobium zavarzinii]